MPILRKLFHRLRRVFLRLLVVWLMYVLGSPILYNWINPPKSAVMLWMDIDYVITGNGYKSLHQWLSINKIPQQLQIAAIAAEDQKFAYHYGIDNQATKDAISRVLKGKKGRGGSTITQQVVKNLYLWNDRSLLRKGLEIPLSLWFDLVVSKRRILEIYLNIAQFGPYEFGLKQGVKKHYNKPIYKLSKKQMYSLISILPSPVTRNPKSNNKVMRYKVTNLNKQVKKLGGIQYLRKL